MLLLVEESGEAFKQILTRERNFVKLVKYIVNAGREVTQVDLVEDLAFYRGGDLQKRELMSLATAYGYKNNMVITKETLDGIEFFTGEQMEVTDLDNMQVSFSTRITEDYKTATPKFDQLHKLVCKPNHHYTAHTFLDGYRDSDHAIQGFNLIILDIDSGVTLASAKELLGDYQALYATTKRHTPELNRFRILMPLSHVVKLSPSKYKEFMQNVFNWLPFPVDDQTSDIARKWESNKGTYSYQNGKMMDATLFIPKTKKQEEQSKRFIDLGNLGNVEKWFIQRTDAGNRSNQMIKFALCLVDNDLSEDVIEERVLAFNKQIPHPLDEAEIQSTVLRTVSKKIALREAK